MIDDSVNSTQIRSYCNPNLQLLDENKTLFLIIAMLKDVIVFNCTLKSYCDHTITAQHPLLFDDAIE
jgi:hypothetical protein